MWRTNVVLLTTVAALGATALGQLPAQTGEGGRDVESQAESPARAESGPAVPHATPRQDLHSAQASASAGERAGAVTAAFPPAVLGMHCTGLPEVLVAHLPQVLADGRGLWVTTVEPGSAAAMAGVQKHDLLLSVGGRAVADVDTLKANLGNVPPAGGWLVSLVRQGMPMTVVIGQPAALVAKGPQPVAVTLPNHPVAISVSRPGLGLALGSADGRWFHVDINYLDQRNVVQRWTCEGTGQTVGQKLSQLPPKVVDQVREQIEGPTINWPDREIEP